MCLVTHYRRDSSLIWSQTKVRHALGSTRAEFCGTSTATGLLRHIKAVTRVVDQTVALAMLCNQSQAWLTQSMAREHAADGICVKYDTIPRNALREDREKRCGVH